jgi:hypothetical protein
VSLINLVCRNSQQAGNFPRAEIGGTWNIGASGKPASEHLSSVHAQLSAPDNSPGPLVYVFCYASTFHWLDKLIVRHYSNGSCAVGGAQQNISIWTHRARKKRRPKSETGERDEQTTCPCLVAPAVLILMTWERETVVVFSARRFKPPTASAYIPRYFPNLYTKVIFEMEKLTYN